MTDNVILFPQKSNKKIQSIEDIERSSKEVANARIEQLCLDITDLILAELYHSGLDIETVIDLQMKDVGLMVEATKSLISRHYRQPHFLNSLSDQLFTETEEGVSITPDIVIDVLKYKEEQDGDNRP